MTSRRPFCPRRHARRRFFCRAGLARFPRAFSAGPRTGGLPGKPGPRFAPIQSRRQSALSAQPGRQTAALGRAMAGSRQAAATPGNPARRRLQKRSSPRHPPGHHPQRIRPLHRGTGQRSRRHRPDRLAQPNLFRPASRRVQCHWRSRWHVARFRRNFRRSQIRSHRHFRGGANLPAGNELARRPTRRKIPRPRRPLHRIRGRRGRLSLL